MTPDKRKANSFRRLSSQLKKDFKITVELSEQVKEFADNVPDYESSSKNPYIYAVAMNLQHFYTSLETSFKRIVKELDGDLPEGSSWHRELLEQVTLEIEKVRPAFISENIKSELDELRRFRHIVRHGYEYELDWSQIQPLVNSLDEIISQLENDYQKFNNFLLKTAEEIETD
ncbi:MAG: hypothetical protein ACOCQA_03680 [bacterium]